MVLMWTTGPFLHTKGLLCVGLLSIVLFSVPELSVQGLRRAGKAVAAAEGRCSLGATQSHPHPLWPVGGARDRVGRGSA